jgi:hypothetical protein
MADAFGEARAFESKTNLLDALCRRPAGLGLFNNCSIRLLASRLLTSLRSSTRLSSRCMGVVPLETVLGRIRRDTVLAHGDVNDL